VPSGADGYYPHGQRQAAARGSVSPSLRTNFRRVEESDKIMKPDKKILTKNAQFPPVREQVQTQLVVVCSARSLGRSFLLLR